MKQTRFNAMLAEDGEIDNIKFPAIASPKIDGVRGLCTGDGVVGRSLRAFNNVSFTRATECLRGSGLDFEITVGDPTDQHVCNRTTSFLNTKNSSTPDGAVTFHVFDSFLYPDMKYVDRLAVAAKTAIALREVVQKNAGVSLVIVPWAHVFDTVSAKHIISTHMTDGYEGSIVRLASAPYKFGRATVKEAAYLRFKYFAIEDAIVKSINEGSTNNNVATTDLRGRTKRSSAAAGKVPNKTVGSLECIDVKSGAHITVGAGAMTAAQRKHYFENPEELIGARIKYKHMPYGAKEGKRMPTFTALVVNTNY